MIRFRLGKKLLPMAMVFAAAACTNTDKLADAPLVPGPAPVADHLPDYRIQVGDTLDIRLLLNPELNEEVSVRPDGYISTTIAHNQRAAGLTVPQLIAALTSDYRHDLQRPRVSVVVKSFAPTEVWVGGQVARPGQIITTGRAPTLAQALASAGGPLLSADESDIFIIRHGLNDKPEFLRVHWKAVSRAENPAADVRLAPEDVVYVPKLGIAEVYKWYNQYIEQFAHPSFGFSYLVGGNTGGVVTTQAPNTGTVVTPAPLPPNTR